MSTVIILTTESRSRSSFFAEHTMRRPTVPTEDSWHGWSHENAAVFVTPTTDEEHVGLYLQQGRSTELAAVFTDVAMAQLFMDWMDEALAATGEANTELLRRLREEQPLLFASSQQPAAPVVGDTDDDDDED